MRGSPRAPFGAMWLLAGLTGCLEVDPAFMGGGTGTDTGSGGSGTDSSGSTGTGPGTDSGGSATSGGSTSAGSGTTGASATTGGCDVVETCNGMDDDCDGLVDEASADNTDCNDCALEQFEDHAYWFCPDTRRWNQARDDCTDMGATLVSIPSEAVNTFLAGHLGNMFADRFWTGGNDQDEEDTFVWEDGTAWGYENWNMGEPNDSNGEDCVEMWSQPAGSWNDSACAEGFAFVCWAPHTQ